MLRFRVAFTRWNPLSDLLTLHERIGQVLGQDSPGWMPPVDLFETADEYVVTAEVPGLSRGDVQVYVRDGKLTIRGERRASGHACEQYHQIERGRGEFFRTFALPYAIDLDSVTADLQNGVLTITVPKAAASGPRRIEVAT